MNHTEIFKRWYLTSDQGIQHFNRVESTAAWETFIAKPFSERWPTYVAYFKGDNIITITPQDGVFISNQLGEEEFVSEEAAREASVTKLMLDGGKPPVMS